MRKSPAFAACLLTALVLLATVDERSFGVVPDGQEMLSAAAALVRFGELGVSRDFAYAVKRAGGDSATRYGMGQTLLEAVPMALGMLVRDALPRRATAPLFVLLQIVLLASAAGATALAASWAGLARRPAVALGVALVLATPLWGYAGSDYSEPLQVAALAGLSAATCALRLGRLAAAAERRWELLAGLSAGIAVLAKSALLVPAGLLLWAAFTAPRQAAAVADAVPEKHKKRQRPVEAPRPRWTLLKAFAVPFALWVVFELVRFGGLFGGYRGERFSYPFHVGLLRLTLLPNKGLLVYAPLVLLALPGLVLVWRRDRRLAGTLAGAVAVILLLAAGWWAWDGQAGWGPRLVLPALPLLLTLAALAVAGSGGAASAEPPGAVVASGSGALRAAAVVLGVAGLAINALSALVPFPQVYALASSARAQPIPERRAAGTDYELARRDDGAILASPPHHLSLTPSWAPPRVHLSVLAAKLDAASPVEVLAAYSPPFEVIAPESPAPAFRAALAPFAWPFWGRSWIAPLPGGVDPVHGALRDQTVRAIDQREYSRAQALGTALLEDAEPPDPIDVALTAEAAALQGRRGDADALLGTVRESCHPWVVFVRMRRGGDGSCIPEAARAGFENGVKAAIAAGAPLTFWGRAGS